MVQELLLGKWYFLVSQAPKSANNISLSKWSPELRLVTKIKGFEVLFQNGRQHHMYKVDILEITFKKRNFLWYLLHLRIYVFDDISGPNWAISLQFAPNSPFNFPLLGFLHNKWKVCRPLKIEKKKRYAADFATPKINTLQVITLEPIELQSSQRAQIVGQQIIFKKGRGLV